MNKATTLIVLVTAVVSVSLTLLLARRSDTGKPAESAQTQARQAAEGKQETGIAGLRLEPAVSGDSWDTVAATGKVGPNAGKVVKIGSRIAGKVVQLRVGVGDAVGPGQVLAVVSSVELARARADYRLAMARVKAAREACQRQVDLAGLGSFSRRPVEEARAEYAGAQGDSAQARGEVAQNKSELVQAESELAQCGARLERARELYKDEIVSRQDLETAEAEHKRDSADIETVKAKIRQAEAKVQQADERARIARGYLQREQKVLDSGLLTRKEVQSARAELTAAELELRAAADTIRVLGASPSGSGDTIAVTSPIGGRVVDRSVTLGEMVEPSSTLLTVMNLSDVWIEASIYEKDLARIHEGQPAEILVNAYPDKLFGGRVTHISDALDPESRTATVRCVVSNPGGLLKPEMFATIQIATAKRGKAVFVPKEAILDDAGAKVVYLSCMECPEDQKAGKTVCGAFDRREVTVGAARNGKTEVRGVQPGELVVAVGAYQLKTALGSGKLAAGCTDH